MNDDRSENFLSRWSRRKRTGDVKDNSARGTVAETSPSQFSDQGIERAAPADSLQADAAYPEAVPPETPDDAATADAVDPTAESTEFPDVDFNKLDFKSDYTRFMDHDVSDATRNRALRKLWVSNPVLANMDGLDDYCEDYTDAAVCLPKGIMKTAYKFGRGFLDDDEVAAWENLGKPEVESAAAAEAEEPGSEAATETSVASDTAEHGEPTISAETTGDEIGNEAGDTADTEAPNTRTA